jgi:hypothetical protein
MEMIRKDDSMANRIRAQYINMDTVESEPQGREVSLQLLKHEAGLPTAKLRRLVSPGTVLPERGPNYGKKDGEEMDKQLTAEAEP